MNPFLFSSFPCCLPLPRNRTALLTLELRFHPPRDPLHSAAPAPPFVLLAHRTALETPLLDALRTHVAERARAKSRDVPAWVHALVCPDADAPDAFAPPLCVMPTALDPLAALGGAHPGPGRIVRHGYYRLDASKPLGELLRGKHFVEFPTVEVWEEDAFEGTIVDDQGVVVRDAEDEPRPKRRKLSAKQAQKAISGLLGGYGSDEEGDEDADGEKTVLGLLGGYAESDEDEAAGAGTAEPEEWGDEDAEGETDEEYEGSPEELAAMLQKLREAGALRNPEKSSALAGLDEEQIDWGESGDEDNDGGT